MTSFNYNLVKYLEIESTPNNELPIETICSSLYYLYILLRFNYGSLTLRARSLENLISFQILYF